MEIDNDKPQEKTGKNDSADHTVATEQHAHEPVASGSGIAKLLVWPGSESTQSEALAEETRQHPNQPKSDERDVGCVEVVSQWKRSNPKRRLIRALLLVVVLTSLVVMIGYLATSSLGGYGFKGVLNRLLSLAAPDGDRASSGQVTGIIHSDDKPSAVIGNSLVHEGDTFYGVRIVKIHFNNVEFEMDGQTWSQRLREKPSKHWPDPLLNGTRQ